MPACSLPALGAEGFGKIVSPVLTTPPSFIVGQQIVAGSKHMILCKQRLVVLEPVEHLV